MAIPIIDLRQLQLGVEVTRGTAVAATHVVDFESATLKLDEKRIRTARSGSLATSHRLDLGIRNYELEIKTIGTYDRTAWWLAAFLAPTVTGAGGGADKTWAFTPSDTTDNLTSFTIEAGGVDTWPTEFQLAGCVGKRMEISIDVDGLWDCTWTFIPMKKVNQARTGALSAAATLVDILGYSTKVYIDTTTIHTTQVTGQAISAKVTVELGTTARHYLGATNGEPGNVVQTSRRNVTAEIVGEWQTLTEFTAYEAATARKVSLDSVGAALGGSNYEARVDIYGSWETWQLGEKEGAITQQLQLAAQYDATATADIKATIVNSVAAIA